MASEARLKSFIGDEIKSTITIDRLPPSIDEDLIKEAVQKAKDYFEKVRNSEKEKKQKKETTR